jgi:DNA-binding transcriptional LysR family regulator
MLPDLNSLALFIRAAEAGSLTKAAEASHMATPAASRRLALLENHFRCQLFRRHSRGLELTPAGECLSRHVRALMDELHRTQTEMAHHASGEAAVLRVSANTSAMVKFFPSDIAAFQQRHPDVRLVLEEHWSEAGAAAVRSGQADLCVVWDGPWTEGLRTSLYRSEQLAVLLPSDHALDAPVVRLQELLECDFVSLEARSSLVGLLSQKAAELGAPLKIRAQVKSFEAVCRMVQAGMGIGVLPRHVAAEFAPAIGLRIALLEDDWATRHMRVCVREGKTEPALDRLLAHLAEAALKYRQAG